MNIVLITGGFDPLHSGHIDYIRAARRLGDRLIVGVNSDAWLERKKGRAFMPLRERGTIVSNIVGVDQVVVFNDSDGSARDAIRQVREQFPKDRIVFANGGDRTADNIPEMSIEDNDLEFQFGVGGEFKKNSSSWILEEWKAPKTERPWGYYRVLHEAPGVKVKELTVNPGQKLSMQRHQHRSEYWLVEQGSGVVASELNSGYAMPPRDLLTHSSHHVEAGAWHQLQNPYNEPLRVVEIQYGSRCDENDIERKS
jgi:cytidyltransferase-like protein